MTRTPPALKQVFAELDAEARAELDRNRQKLPAWIGFYVYPNELGGEAAEIMWRSRERIPHGEAIPTHKGHKPRFATIVDGADKLDPAVCYLMRFWMAEKRRRLAIQHNDRAAQRAATGLVRWLRAHPPSFDHGARTIARENVKRDTKAAAEWQQWQDEANRIWTHNPKLKRWRVAERAKKNLESNKSQKTIWRQIHPPK